jgi:hypothetical protein
MYKFAMSVTLANPKGVPFPAAKESSSFALLNGSMISITGRMGERAYSPLTVGERGRGGGV